MMLTTEPGSEYAEVRLRTCPSLKQKESFTPKVKS